MATHEILLRPGSAGAACNPRQRIAIVIPVFNDWESVTILLSSLDAIVGQHRFLAHVVVVDDGSVLPPADDFRSGTYASLKTIELLRLRRNLGHQRAIAVGLTHVYETCQWAEAIVVMDGDGEDRPEDVPALIDELVQHPDSCAIFAARTKRLEHWRFRLMYSLYRTIHYLLTGIAVRVGNFSALTPSALHRLVVVSELWNHYAAAVFQSRIPYHTVPIPRGRRYSGHSQMNFPELVRHGLSAISVFAGVVGSRLLIMAGATTGLAVILLAIVLGLRTLTDLAIPGWATSAAGLLVIIVIQSLLFIVVISIVILANRSDLTLIPLRDTKLFLESVQSVWSGPLQRSAKAQ